LGIVDPLQEVDERRLASTSRTNNGDGLASRNVERDILDARARVRELERNVLKCDVAGNAADRAGTQRLAALAACIFHRIEGLELCAGLEHLRHKCGDLVETANQQRGEARKGNDVA